jgi:16S rRNA (cytosine1402-N4)-methyltransferase
MKIPHIPVLYNEVLDIFKDINNDYIIDCTVGYGGHSYGLIKQNHNIKLICNDQDEEALDFSKNRLIDFHNRIMFNKDNFSKLINKFISFPIKGILADIGVSSLQLDKLERGFSFKSSNLDMRMDRNQDLTAEYIINNYSKKDLEKLLKDYGEVKDYINITSLIIKNRPFDSAKQLSDLLTKNINKFRISPATLVFQALRIEVNNELSVLKDLFNSIEKSNLKNCIVTIISFHSLEDRIVKNYFKKWSSSCICEDNIMKCLCGNNNKKGNILTKKPITPTSYEINKNPRSRSSKLRVFKFD